jgi:hypothetical protein
MPGSSNVKDASQGIEMVVQIHLPAPRSVSLLGESIRLLIGSLMGSNPIRSTWLDKLVGRPEARVQSRRDGA